MDLNLVKIVQPRKTHSDITEKLFIGMKRIKSMKQQIILKMVVQFFLTGNFPNFDGPDAFLPLIQQAPGPTSER